MRVALEHRKGVCSVGQSVVAHTTSHYLAGGRINNPNGIEGTRRMGADDFSLLRYLESCKLVAAGYVERATRFNVKDMLVLDARPVTRNFLITIRHELEVTSEVEDFHGVHKPGQEDFGSADWKWYQEEVQAQALSEFTRPETMESLVREVRSQAYAAISAKTCIRTHPRRLFHTYKCSGCHGAGKVSCGGCSGSGKVRCNGCYGNGRVNCSTCHGSGTTTQVRQVRDYSGHSRSETQYRSCGSCSGGRVNCTSCGGSGKNCCGNCGGSGRVICTGCSGHGSLTRVTTTRTHTAPTFAGRYPEGTPDYVHLALSKVGFANLERHGDISLQSTNVVQEKSAAEFTYECSMPFCELTVEVRGLKSNWILFGAHPQIFDAGGALESLLKTDFELLAKLAKSRSRWLPWFHRSAKASVAPFMESEVNQEVIDASFAGLAPHVIFERVNRSVSEAYIEEMLRNLKTTVSVAANWSRFKWLTTFIVLSIPFSLAAVAYIDRDKRLKLFSPSTQLIIYGPNTTGVIWEMALLTIPFTLFGWFAAKWISTHWLKNAGGKRTVLWAGRQGLLMGKWSALTIIVAAAGTTGAFFNRWPLWIDTAGNAYGRFALFQAPQVSSRIKTKVIEKKRTAERKRPLPKRHVTVVTAKPPPTVVEEPSDRAWLSEPPQ